jgi:eukaryotic-like serine/threonine-protein kinase
VTQVNMDKTNPDPGSAVPRPASDPQHEPRNLGDYRILRRLGEGGMGAVYLAYHEREGKQVALKVLPDALASNQAYVDRFYREARSGAALNHPNIVRCIDASQDRLTGKHYLVLEFVDGISALALLEKGSPLAVGDAVHIALDIARGLEHAHSRNIVHRDIKPDNILITRSGVAKLSDLGLAKRTDEISHLTATRQGFGTPHYMPYEQALNARHADARSDIYALGATLYHLVAGEVPFPGVNHLDVMDKKNVGTFPPASIHNPRVTAQLDEILDRMMARDPDARYQTASELIVDLERSRLASPVPSFADPDLARNDPWVQQCMTSSAQPTVPDLAGIVAPPAEANGAANGKGDVWYLRRRDREGNWRTAKTTTRQVLRYLRAGRLRSRVEASRSADGEFRSLDSYPQFRDVKPVKPRRKKGKPAGQAKAAPAPASGRLSWYVLAAGAALGVLGVGGLIYYFVRHLV